jgi:hypothetical protein
MLCRKSKLEKIVESPWTTVALGGLAGVVGTIAMEPVTTFLYQHEDEAHKKREEELRKESSLEVLAARLIELIGAEPSEQRKQQLATALHWIYGMGWGALYALLRRRGGGFGRQPAPNLWHSRWGFSLPRSISTCRAFVLLRVEFPDR